MGHPHSYTTGVRVAVVVPATDDPPELDRCLAALRSSTRQPDELEVVRSPPGSGPAAARNQGVRRTESELILFVDSDVSVSPEAIARVAARFAGDPELAALFGTYDEHPTARGVVSRFRNLAHRRVHLEAAGEARTFWAGLGAVRREWFERVGGFDADRYPAPAIEDIELGLRLSEAGARIVLDPGVQGTHHKRWTFASMVRTDLMARAVPWSELIIERRDAGGGLNLGATHAVAALASPAIVAGVAASRPRLALAALAALMTARRGLLAELQAAGGIRLALASLPALVAHHLCALAGPPVAVARMLGRRGRVQLPPGRTRS